MAKKFSVAAVKVGREMVKAGPIAIFSGKYSPHACPLCFHDHQTDKKHLEGPFCDCDFEKCGECGFDHEYEPAEANKWHAKHVLEVLK